MFVIGVFLLQFTMDMISYYGITWRSERLQQSWKLRQIAAKCASKQALSRRIGVPGVLRTDKRAKSTSSAVRRMCLADLTAASVRPFDWDQYGEDVI